MSLTLTLERGGGEVSGSGTNIELDGTIAGGAIESVEMYGDTEQQTYSGKNLMTLTSKTSSGVSGTITDGSTITVSGTATTTDGVSVADLGKNIPAGTYTFTIDHAANHVINFTINTSSDNVAFRLGAGETSATKTLSSDSTGGQIFWAVTNGQTYNETFKMQLVSGSTADYDFEPYVGGVASPNPDYPQEVQTVTGRQLVTISDGGSESQEYEVNLGKNLCDGINQEYWLTSTATGAGVSSGNSGLIIPIEQNTSYTISTTSSQARYRVAFSDQTYQGSQFNCYNGASRDGTSDTITRNSGNHKYLIVNATDLTKIQVEKSSTATSFAPYFTPIELCKIGTYQDYIYKSGDDWYLHKETGKYTFDGSESLSYSANGGFTISSTNVATYFDGIKDAPLEGYSDKFVVETRTNTWTGEGKIGLSASNVFWLKWAGVGSTSQDCQDWLSANTPNLYYALATPTDTQITNSALIAQLDALNSAQTYDGETVITVGSENLAGPLEVKAATNIEKTYTEVEIGSPFTITDVEGKSSNTTLDGNVYVDWAYNKKQYSFDLFNLTPQDYADIRAFYDYQFSSSAFPTITVPELNIDKLPVYMEISSRNIINQCLLTDKLTIKFRETVQP